LLSVHLAYPESLQAVHSIHTTMQKIVLSSLILIQALF